jgi:uncharacterized repeat protein (TIGR01451 family)
MKKTALLGVLVCALVWSATVVAVAGPPAPAKRAKLTLPRPQPAVSAPPASGPLAADAFVTFDDIPAKAIALGESTPCDGGALIRTFNVAQSFTVVDVRLGFNANHEFRGDLRVALKSPTGTVVEVISPVSTNSAGNYDLMLTDASLKPVDDVSNDDTAKPYFDREAAPANPFSAFFGENSAGAWTLSICDVDPALSNGAYNLAQLGLEAQPGGPLLRAAKTADALVVTPGSRINYSIVIRNLGQGAATGATLKDDIPAGASFIPGSLTTTGNPPAAFSGSAVTWTGTVAAGQTVTIAYEVTVTAAQGFVTNTAVVSHPSLSEPLRASVVSQVFPGYDRAYTSEAALAIPDDECATQVSSKIKIGDNFQVTDLLVGLSVDHPYRGDISAVLRSPAGTEVKLVAADGENLNRNYDVLLDDASAGRINDESDDDTSLPLYDRTAAPAELLSGMKNVAPAGEWTLTVCDNASGDAGELQRWSLFFRVSAAPPMRKTFLPTLLR